MDNFCSGTRYAEKLRNQVGNYEYRGKRWTEERGIAQAGGRAGRRSGEQKNGQAFRILKVTIEIERESRMMPEELGLDFVADSSLLICSRAGPSETRRSGRSRAKQSSSSSLLIVVLMAELAGHT